MNHSGLNRAAGALRLHRAAPVDMGTHLDAHYTHAAMRAIARRAPTLLADELPGVRARLDNALLNVAVNRLVRAEGRTSAAAILWRLADALQDGSPATPQRPVDLTAQDDDA